MQELTNINFTKNPAKLELLQRVSTGDYLTGAPLPMTDIEPHRHELIHTLNQYGYISMTFSPFGQSKWLLTITERGEEALEKLKA